MHRVRHPNRRQITGAQQSSQCHGIQAGNLALDRGEVRTARPIVPIAVGDQGDTLPYEWRKLAANAFEGV